ncbi:hypothetical protein CAL26_06425 [Bordetella genomosp. 9]|uniref:Uncharacterized protein n=1 Tax=Bordetella genomosp. 9 TaxID=1416803 RepID=A0A261REL9_9BORD|nr:hypothetical protein CAL26_06425 [Bordetella genomosp. 9]
MPPITRMISRWVRLDGWELEVEREANVPVGVDMMLRGGRKDGRRSGGVKMGTAFKSYISYRY